MRQHPVKARWISLSLAIILGQHLRPIHSRIAYHVSTLHSPLMMYDQPRHTDLPRCPHLTAMALSGHLTSNDLSALIYWQEIVRSQIPEVSRGSGAGCDPSWHPGIPSWLCEYLSPNLRCSVCVFISDQMNARLAVSLLPALFP